MKQFKGIYAALMTPFGKDGKVNFDAMGKLIDRCIQSGVSGFYVCGSTGEGLLLSVRERNEIYAFVGEYAAGRAKLIAHVGSLATRDAVAMAKNVRKCGFDAVSAVPPFYYAYGFEEIAGYYRAIADAAGLPDTVYNFPNAGTKFTIRDIEELFRDARFAGIKHTSQDLYQLERYKHLGREIAVFNGYDEMLLAGLSMGADGGIGSTYNCLPRTAVGIYKAFCEGRIADAQKLQTFLNEFVEQIVRYGVFACEKEILTLTGIPMGDCRAPFRPLGEEGKQAMKSIVNKLREQEGDWKE